jgi:hypothetical protein
MTEKGDKHLNWRRVDKALDKEFLEAQELWHHRAVSSEGIPVGRRQWRQRRRRVPPVGAAGPVLADREMVGRLGPVERPAQGFVRVILARAGGLGDSGEGNGRAVRKRRPRETGAEGRTGDRRARVEERQDEGLKVLVWRRAVCPAG